MPARKGRGRGRGRGAKKADPVEEVPAEEVEEEVKEEAEEEQAEEEAVEEQEEEVAAEEEEAMETEETEEAPAAAAETSSPVKAPETKSKFEKIDKNAESLFLQVRGFPYEVEDSEIMEYFNLEESEHTGFSQSVGIRGKPCGEAFFKCANEDVASRIVGKHKEAYGDTGRYIDVFRCSEEYYHRRLSVNLQFSKKFDGTIKFRGLPFAEDPEETVKGLLKGLSYLEETMICPKSASGKSTGIGFVQFASFTEANKALSKNGTDGIQVLESCNNDLRCALLAQTKLTFMKKWADPQIGGGTTMFKERTNPMAGHKRESQEEQGVEEVEEKKPRTDDSMADAEPVAEVQAPVESKPKPVNNSPYPHIITLSNVTAGTKATEIQKFFKPHRAIAVNIRAGGIVDVAFKSHEICEAAMGKQGSNLKDFVPDFELRSVQ